MISKIGRFFAVPVLTVLLAACQNAPLSSTPIASTPADIHIPLFAKKPYEPFSRDAAVQIAYREWRAFGQKMVLSPNVPESADSEERDEGLWQPFVAFLAVRALRYVRRQHHFLPEGAPFAVRDLHRGIARKRLIGFFRKERDVDVGRRRRDRGRRQRRVLTSGEQNRQYRDGKKPPNFRNHPILEIIKPGGIIDED